MIDPTTVFTIVLMSLATYLTRIGGFALLRNRQLSARTLSVLDAAPGCVLIAVIAPNFVTRNPADIIALVCTMIAATKLPLLPTVIIGIVSAGFLRSMIPA